MVKLYRERIADLKIKHESPHLPSHQELNQICGDLSQFTSKERKNYGDPINISDPEKNIISFDINNDGTKEVAESCSGGTMHVPCVEYKTPDGNKLTIDTINYEWKTYWTYGHRPFYKNGKWFSFHSYDDHYLKPAYVSYLTPDNNEFVVCEFENLETEIALPNLNIEGAEQVCEEITLEDSPRIKAIKLHDRPTITLRGVHDLGRRETGLERQGYLDYDNDGIQNYIGELEYASGAGRGCDYNYFDELSEDKKSFLESTSRNLLLKMQKVDLKARHPNCGSSNPNSRGYMNRFFEFDGKNYYEFKTRTDRAIFKLENNKIDTICSFRNGYVTTVKSIGVPN